MSWWSQADIELEIGTFPKAGVNADRLAFELKQSIPVLKGLGDTVTRLLDTLGAVAAEYDREASEAVIERGEDAGLWPALFDADDS